jgi:hypothetical protein
VKGLISSALLLFAISAGASAQEAPSPGNIFSSDLVAWSGMQQPRVPEQNSQKQKPEADQGSQAAATQSPTASSYTGTVGKEGNDFVLKVSETTTYKLDSRQEIEQYDGQRVRVTGTLESGVNIIHVDRIEPVS